MEGKETEEAHEGSSACMAASSTYRLPLTGCTIAIASTFFAPPPTCLSSTRILHLQGGVTLKTLPVLNYSVPLSFSLSSSSSSTSFYSSRFFCFFSSANFFTSITPLSLSSPLGFCLDTPFPVVVSCFFFFFFSSFSFNSIYSVKIANREVERELVISFGEVVFVQTREGSLKVIGFIKRAHNVHFL